MEINETWRDIPGLEGYYEVSICGRVRRRNFNIFYLNDACNKRGLKIIKPQQSHNGYLWVPLHLNGKVKNYRINRLVGLAFPEICGEYFEGAVCNHLNENKADNRAENLRWCTQKENINWGTHNERMSKSKINGSLSKPVLQYMLNGEFVKEWASTREVERQTGFFQTNICSCCNGKYKQAYGYIWKYKETLPN